ncbi:sensor histidine kinase [Crossiella sp. SN42]|uniref:sensor histidine kinase n=1 Tax=Crossiella sp. SN42 TaxID=2944808 RepID=UPI00207D0AA3|nr:sensor histidine kinase [Crossiella sp. SN42]MCO1574608.1 sensor histidine kinase [Crossiella sp. SN42]
MNAGTGGDAHALHVASAVAVALVAVLSAVWGAPWHAYPLLIALVLWYVTLARPLVGRSTATAPGVRAIGYLAGAIALVTALVLASPPAVVLVVVLYTHTFWLLDRLWLATLVIAVATTATALAVAAQFGGSGLIGLAVTGGAVSTFLIGTGVGLLVRRQVEQERQRDLLIRDLESARAELAAVYRREGARAERERMARDIHDTLAQGFTSLVMLVQTAKAALDRDLDLARRQLAMAEHTARDNLAEARALVHASQPDGLRHSGLAGAVRRLAEQLGALASLTCVVRADGFTGALTANEEVAIMRAVQEAFANIHKHAGATAASVTLTSRAGGTALEITDNGRGFRPAEADGYGLSGMRARIEEIGGSVVVTSAPGEGTRVKVWLP